ncbi:MAG: hypothetical protein ACT4ON_06815 [Bacteroidota bacterium]
MKTKILICSCIIALSFGFTIKVNPIQAGKIKKPRICINDYKKEVQEGELINCRKIDNMGVVVHLNQDMQKYDNFQVEMHRFGTDGDVMVAYRPFIPEEKEFQKKYAALDSLKLSMINPMDTDNSDFITNTLKFKMSQFIIEHVVCTIHELQHCNFYVVIKGYKKTGKTNKFGEEEYDNGVELSERSIVFRNWEKK